MRPARCLAPRNSLPRIAAPHGSTPWWCARRPETQFSPSEEVLSSQRETTLREDEAERAASLRASFEAWATNVTGIVTDWIDIDGIVELQVEERGRRADCVVIERPSQHDYGTSWQESPALFTTDPPAPAVPLIIAANLAAVSPSPGATTSVPQKR